MRYGKNGREDLVVRGARVLDPVEVKVAEEVA